MKPITKDDICAALKDVGVHSGQTLMVHTSLSREESKMIIKNSSLLSP